MKRLCEGEESIVGYGFNNQFIGKWVTAETLRWYSEEFGRDIGFRPVLNPRQRKETASEED